MTRTGLLLSSAVLSLALLSPAAAKTLVYCSEASPETFTPMIGVADSTMDAAAKTIFNRLVEFKPGTAEVAPALAERWDVSEDGTVYTFHLRRGVKFHSNEHFTPTREFNADDVVYTFQRQRDSSNPYHGLGGANYQYYNALGLASLIAGVEKIDDYTVRFKLTSPNVTFLSGIALDYLSIMSLEQTEKMVAAGRPELIDNAPVGTGPFIFSAYVLDSNIRFTANKDYWRGAPKIDTLIFAITPEPTVRMTRLKAGECHVAIQPPPASLPELASDPNITVVSREGQNIGLVTFNTEHAPLDDKRVRQALSMAIDRKAIVNAVYGETGVVAGSVIPPAQLGYASDAAIAYDPEGAKNLLKEAGHASDLSVTLWAMPVSRTYNPNARRMAEMIQADWQGIGVESKIVSVEWGEFLSRSSKGEHDTLLIGGSSDNGDPDNLLSYLLACEGVKGGSNRSRWCNTEFEALIQEARITQDLAKRADLYRQAQQILKTEVPVMPIAHSIVSVPIRKEVLNYSLDAFGRQNFAGVDLAE